VRRTVLGVGNATSGITANVLTLLLPPNFLARDLLNPYLQAARRKEVEQRQSGADHNVIANSLGKSIAHSSTDRIPYSEFSLLKLIGTAFPQGNEVRTRLCLGSTEIAQWSALWPSYLCTVRTF